jgi:peptide/nickel transport system substrate-binding protein
MSRKSIVLALGLLVLASLVLAACTPQTIETIKTVEVVTTQIVEGTPVVNTVVVTATPAPTEPVAVEPRTLVICQGQEPETLNTFNGNMLAMSHVLEAIYDGPIDTRSFEYQAIILEKLPSLADGDAVIQAVDVTAGAMVTDNDGNAVELAADTMIRPTGCNAADCAVAYDGTSTVQMDQLVVTFKMLPGLLWSDGTPLTAADSVYAFNLTADPDNPQSKYLPEHTQSYEAADDVTVVWTALPGYMDSTYFANFFSPKPEHIWGQYTMVELLTEVDGQMLYTGWGPYIITEWVKGDHITAIKNPNYFRASEGLPVFETVIWRFVGANSNANIAAVLAGDCDIVDQTSSLDDQSELLLELQAAGQINATFVTGTTWEHTDQHLPRRRL